MSSANSAEQNTSAIMESANTDHKQCAPTITQSSSAQNPNQLSNHGNTAKYTSARSKAHQSATVLSTSANPEKSLCTKTTIEYPNILECQRALARTTSPNLPYVGTKWHWLTISISLYPGETKFPYHVITSSAYTPPNNAAISRAIMSKLKRLAYRKQLTATLREIMKPTSNKW